MTARGTRGAALAAISVFSLITFPLMASGGNEKAGTAGQPITFGVSGPLTGDWAQYGAQWKKGFDLALEQINASGGVSGRSLAYVFEDSQSG